APRGAARPSVDRARRSIVLLVAVVVIAFVVLSDGPQGVLEDPLGHLAALLAPEDVGGAEVDALEDAGLDDVIGRAGEVRIGPARRKCRGIVALYLGGGE